jgi:hypothetical protein
LRMIHCLKPKSAKTTFENVPRAGFAGAEALLCGRLMARFKSCPCYRA